MPLYEYICDDCHQRFDRRVATFDKVDAINCASCESANVRRQISRVAFMSTGHDIPVSNASESGGCCGGSCACGHG